MIRAAILTVSDSVATGVREDRSGAALAEVVGQNGWIIADTSVTPDESKKIAAVVAKWADSGEIDVVLCTGGTGLAPRDVTPEARHSIAPREAPGFGEVMRAQGRKSTPFAALSRSGAFTRGETLILALPGSPGGAVESLHAVVELIPHAVNLLHGHTKHDPKPSPESEHHKLETQR
jgi:molybdenum cofactor synthesis domain-containing protein